MTKSGSHPKADATPEWPIIVFGLSKEQKPQAARFPGNLADLAKKAAAQMSLGVVAADTAEAEALAKRLPSGRIHANGRGFIPNVQRGLYDEILKLATTAAPKAGGVAGATPNEGTASKSIPKNEGGTEGNPAGSAGLPSSWKDLAAGHLVLVQESLKDGWWEAVVVSRQDKMLTLRWRDYPRYRPFACHVDAVALVNPTPSF
jgi:hypothetical protein